MFTETKSGMRRYISTRAHNSLLYTAASHFTSKVELARRWRDFPNVMPAGTPRCYTTTRRRIRIRSTYKRLLAAVSYPVHTLLFTRRHVVFIIHSIVRHVVARDER